MSAQRHTLPDTPSAADACARRITGLLETALAGGTDATFAVSGGTTAQVLFQKLAALRFDWSRIHLFWVDERCVPPSDPASNYKLAKDWLLPGARFPERNIHRVLGEIAPNEAAHRYREEIRTFFQLNPGEMPRLDVVHCGMGPDGHTASLFPGSPLIEDRAGIADATFAPQFNQWRVTLLPGPLLAARNVIYFVPGSDKAEAARAVFDGPPEPKKYPAQLIGTRGEWFLDDAAAALL